MAQQFSNILDNTTELYMTKYIIGEIFSSCGETLYKNPSDQTVIYVYSSEKNVFPLKQFSGCGFCAPGRYIGDFEK